MAQEEHLAVLKQGIEAWNQWRADNPDVRPDLKGADFSRSELSGVNLSFGGLSVANLRESGIKLPWSGLSREIAANLRGTDLREANLSDANLSKADMQGA